MDNLRPNRDFYTKEKQELFELQVKLGHTTFSASAWMVSSLSQHFFLKGISLDLNISSLLVFTMNSSVEDLIKII